MHTPPPHTTRTNQSGVVSGLLAILIIPLVVILIGLGIDVTRAKYASSELKFRVDEICKEVAAHSTTQKSGALIFRQRVQLLLNEQRIPGLRLTAARLIAPTMSEDPLNVPYDQRPYKWNEATAGAPLRKSPCRDLEPPFDADPYSPGGGRVTNFGAIVSPNPPNDPLVGACTLDNGQDCQFVSDLCAGGITAEDPNYPSGFWSNLEDAGGTVGCELEGELSRIVSSSLIGGLQPSRITARVVWAAEPPRAKYYDPALLVSPQVRGFDPSAPVVWQDGSPLSIEPNIPYKPLTIAVAPELNLLPNINPIPDTTDPLSFAFTANGEISYDDIGGAAPGFRERYDPLLPPLPSNPATPARNFFGSASTAAIDQIIADIPALAGNTQIDFLKACVNPPALIRNILSSVIAELASRHGLYRFNTEALSIPPTRYDPIIDPYPPSSPAKNPAVMLAEFGQDIAERSFQAPFVTSFRGNFSLSSPFRNWNNPAAPIPDPDPVASANRAKFAGQLRDCYHLYSQDIGPFTGTRTGIQRYFDPLFMGGMIENSGFEPSKFDRYQMINTFLPNTPSWSQLSGIWSNPPNPPPPPGSNSRNLSLGEVLGTLGSIRSCPENPPSPTADDCTQTATSFEPDLYALVYYLVKDADGDGNTDTNAFALRSPGYWSDYTLPYSFPGTAPFGPDFIKAGPTQPHHVFAPNRKSTVVIFTHYAPSYEQALAIQGLINLEPLENRRIYKIVFIPPNSAAHSQIGNLTTAFNIQTGPGQTGAITSEIFDLSPENPEIPFMSVTPPRSYGASDADYARYWFDILGYQYSAPGGDFSSTMYVGEMARKFFYERLATPAVKF